jgi:hypothetical protein
LVLVLWLATACDYGLAGPVEIANESPDFTISLRYTGTQATLRYQDALVRAVRRWESIVVGDLADYHLSLPAGACLPGQQALDERIDDVLILVELGRGDGPGGLVGEGGPCSLRTENLLPVMGYVKLDVSDLEQISSQEMLDGVVLHEIGHVLGIGTLWRAKNLITGFDSHDPRVTGAQAMEAYRSLGGDETGVPAESNGGVLTRAVHWRESVFTNELMTGYLDSGANPISELTIGTLRDLGYAVNRRAASEYTMGAAAKEGARIDLTQRERMKVWLLPN